MFTNYNRQNIDKNIKIVLGIISLILIDVLFLSVYYLRTFDNAIKHKLYFVILHFVFLIVYTIEEIIYKRLISLITAYRFLFCIIIINII